MANIGKWNAPGAVQTALTGASINSTANNTMTSASSTIANQTNLDIYIDLEVFLNTLSPSTGAYVAIYIWEAIDGSNFPSQSDADLRLTTTQLLCTIPIGTTASSTQRVVARNIVIPPGSFQIKLDNQTGVALNAASNTVRYIAYDINGNG